MRHLPALSTTIIYPVRLSDVLLILISVPAERLNALNLALRLWPVVLHRWRFSLVCKTLVSISVVTLRWARLVPGWVTVFGRVNYLGM